MNSIGLIWSTKQKVYARATPPDPPLVMWECPKYHGYWQGAEVCPICQSKTIKHIVPDSAYE